MNMKNNIFFNLRIYSNLIKNLINIKFNKNLNIRKVIKNFIN